MRHCCGPLFFLLEQEAEINAEVEQAVEISAELAKALQAAEAAKALQATEAAKAAEIVLALSKTPVESEEICTPPRKQETKLEKPTLNPKPSDALFRPVYRVLDSLMRQNPTNTGLGGISGHFTPKYMLEIFTEIDKVLTMKNLAWKDQVFLDVGFGEGYPMFCAAQLCPARGIDIDHTLIFLYTQLTSQRVPTNFPTCVALADINDWKKIPSDVTILYSFNSAFPPLTNQHFLSLIRKAPNLVCVVLGWDTSFGEGTVIRAKMSGRSSEQRSMIVWAPDSSFFDSASS